MLKLILINFQAGDSIFRQHLKRNPLISLIQQKNAHDKKNEKKELKPLEIYSLHPVPGHFGKGELRNSLKQTRPTENGDQHSPVFSPDVMGDHVKQSNDYGQNWQENNEFIILCKGEKLFDPLRICNQKKEEQHHEPTPELR